MYNLTTLNPLWKLNQLSLISNARSYSVNKSLNSIFIRDTFHVLSSRVYLPRTGEMVDIKQVGGRATRIMYGFESIHFARYLDSYRFKMLPYMCNNTRKKKNPKSCPWIPQKYDRRYKNYHHALQNIKCSRRVPFRFWMGARWIFFCSYTLIRN